MLFRSRDDCRSLFVKRVNDFSDLLVCEHSSHVELDALGRQRLGTSPGAAWPLLWATSALRICFWPGILGDSLLSLSSGLLLSANRGGTHSATRLYRAKRTGTFTTGLLVLLRRCKGLLSVRQGLSRRLAAGRASARMRVMRVLRHAPSCMSSLGSAPPRSRLRHDAQRTEHADAASHGQIA